MAYDIVSFPEAVEDNIGMTGSWSDNCVIRADGDQDNASFQGSDVYIDDNSYMGIGSGASSPCSQLELWDDDAHPILSITAAHATDYDPQVQFRTDATDTVKCSLGVDASDDSLRINMGSGVGGATHFIMDTNGGVKWQNSTDSTTAYQWLDADGGTPILNIDSTNERVGIGTDAPGYELDVVGVIRVKAANHQIRLHDTDTGNDEWTITTLAGDLGFYEDGTTRRLWLTSDGGLSVGRTTGSVEFQFEVVGEGAIAKIARYNEDNVNRAPSFLFERSRGTQVSQSDIIAGDWLGKIQVRGQVSTFLNYGALGYIAIDTSQHGRFGFFDNDLSTERFSFLTSAGTFGIGETAPETAIELTKAEPYFTFHNSTEEDTDGGRESKLLFKGEQSGGEESTLAEIRVFHDGSSNDQKGGIAWYTNDGSDDDTPTERMRIDSNGYIGINESSPDSQTEIASSAAGVTALHLKAAASQTANIFRVTDSSDNNLVWITSGGKIQGDKGLRTTANDWGDGLATWSYGEYTAEHTITDDAGNFDATGNAAGEKYFYDTTNSPFTQDDEDNRNWIVIQSGTFKGAKAEILEYISADGVLLHSHGTCWDEDLSSVDYKIVKAPQLITSACYDTHIHVGTSGQVHIGNSGGAYTGDVGVEIEFSMGADNSDAFHIHCDAGGYSNCDAVQIFYDTGALQSGDLTQVMQITLDETAASGGTIACIHFDTTDVSAAEKRAICVGVGFDSAFCVAGSSSEDPDYGYEITSGSVVDRVNSGGAGDDAFVNAAVDQEIFDNDNDYILIGSDETFEVIEVILDTVSSKDLVLEFYYSKTGGNWTQFYPDDSTQGFTRSGLISFSAPGDWTEDDEAEANGDITEGYYVKIMRTYSYVVPTLPTESYFKIYAERAGDTGMKIRGDGAVKLPYLTGAPSSLENGLMWAESDGIHAYFNGSEEVLATV